MMLRFSEGLHRTMSIGRRRRLPLLTWVSFMAVLAMTASAYADNEKHMAKFFIQVKLLPKNGLIHEL